MHPIIYTYHICIDIYVYHNQVMQHSDLCGDVVSIQKTSCKPLAMLRTTPIFSPCLRREIKSAHDGGFAALLGNGTVVYLGIYKLNHGWSTYPPNVPTPPKNEGLIARLIKGHKVSKPLRRPYF